MKTSTRFIAATLIAGSALFGLSPVASADESVGPKDRTSSSQQAPKMPEPPANAPKFVKRIIKQVNKAFDRNRGPIPDRRNSNVVCSVFGTHCN